MKLFTPLLALLIVATSMAQEVPETIFNRWKEKVDPSVERGLDFLARIQQDDGSFPENYGTSTGIPALAITISSPSSTCANKRERFVLASWTFTVFIYEND